MLNEILQISTILPWIFGVAAFCGLVVIILLLVDRKRMQQAAYAQWESYLESIQTSLHRLRFIEQSLQQAKDDDKEAVLLPPSDSIDQTIQEEMAILRSQLDEIENTPNHFCYLKSVLWRSFPPLHHDIQHLLELTHDRVLDEHDVASRARKQVEKTMHDSLKMLRGKNQTMAQMLEELTGQYSELRKKWEKAKKTDATRARGKMKEEESAASLMSELESGLPSEEIEARLKEVQDQTDAINKKLADSMSDKTKTRRLEVKRNWLQQVKRWWSIQYKMRQQEQLLLTASENMTDIENLETRNRFDKWLNLRAIEGENIDIRNKLGEKELQCRVMSRQLESLDSEHLAMNTLLDKVTRATEMESLSSYEINKLENAIEQAFKKIAHTELADKRISQLERQLIDYKNLEQEYFTKIKALERQVKHGEKAFENEREQFKVSVGLLENALNIATQQEKSIQSGMKEFRNIQNKSL